MKPHYILTDGAPTRVGYLNDKRVILFMVPGSKSACHECIFNESRCPEDFNSRTILGTDCTDHSRYAYKEVA